MRRRKVYPKESDLGMLIVIMVIMVSIGVFILIKVK
jgi:hypothetical protein